MSASKFRKKPVVIDAIQWDGSVQSTAAIHNFCSDAQAYGMMRLLDDGSGAVTDEMYGYPLIYIKTLEGGHWARVGDWIIKGIKGEFYPCKPEIFSATYDPVE